MKVIDFDHDAGLLELFLDFPRQLYASDSNWMPDPAEARQLADSGSQQSLWRNFLALDGDEVCGRVTASVNPRLCDENNQPYGQLGFYECIDDRQASRLLLDRATSWLQENVPAGARILAPMNFDTWHSYRFRIRGFDEPTFFMEPYNPSYYPSLLAAHGFEPASRYITKTVTDLSPLLAFWEPHHRKDAAAKGFTCRSINLEAVREEISLIHRLSQEIFRENLFFTEISEADFRALYAAAAGSLDPDLFLFLLDASGEPVGLCFVLADHRQPERANVKTFGLLPHIRHTGVGAGFAHEIYSRLQAKGFTSVNHCLMRAGNRAEAFDGGLGEITREYTLYSRSLES